MNEKFRLFGRMTTLLIATFTDAIIQYILHFRLPQKIEYGWLVKFATVIHEPYTHLITASKPCLSIVLLRIGFVQNNRCTKREESSSFQLISNPTCIAVAEEKYHTCIRLEDTLVLFANLKDKFEIIILIIPLIPFTKVGFYDLASFHGESWLVRDIVREV